MTLAMSLTAALLADPAAGLADPATGFDEGFELDFRLVQSAIPITKLMCDTSDGCGSSCCSSACATSAADPFSF
jgi:FxLD family lantipeptide